MSSWALRTLRSIAYDLQSFEDGRFSHDAVDAIVLRLELVYRELLVGEYLEGHSDSYTRVCSIVGFGIQNLQELNYESNIIPGTPPMLRSGHAGRPKFDIPREQMSALVESGFTGPQIADLLQVSLSTIRRRMAQYGLYVSSVYAILSDGDLDQMIHDIKVDFPTCGCKQMQGHLQARGVRVQQVRVRESLRRVDPEGSIMRRLSSLHRRQYQVAAPRSLWHMDGNHKLIR